MTWFVIVFNNKKEIVEEVLPLERDDPIPFRILSIGKDVPHIDVYFHCITEDDRVRWGWLEKRSKVWQTPYLVPDPVKMVIMLT